MQFIGDNPKRSWAKFCQCHSSWYACDYCFAKGIKIEISDNVRARNKIAIQINSVQEQINVCQRDPNNPENIVELNNLFALKEQLQKSMNSLKRKSHILWPYSTMGSEHRSRQSIYNIYWTGCLSKGEWYFPDFIFSEWHFPEQTFSEWQFPERIFSD